MTKIDERREQLLNFDRAMAYSKQKDALRKELESFLSTLPGNITVATVTPRDICRFLIFKDRNGKTQIHHNRCPHLGKRVNFHVCVRFV